MGVGMEDLMEKVEQWAEDKGIDEAESWKPQFKKIVEEVMEYKEELKKFDHRKGMEYLMCYDEMVEMGDILITLIIMAQQRGYEIKDCLTHAYLKIKDRQGEVIDGSFVKSEDIGNFRKDSEDIGKMECSLGG
jgi:glutathionylspermidine synthase